MLSQKLDLTRLENVGLPFSGSLLLRAQDYAHPQDVLWEETLTASEKRSLLEAWASDAARVEAHPGFRWLPGTPGPIALPHVQAALEMLDDMTERRGDQATRH